MGGDRSPGRWWLAGRHRPGRCRPGRVGAGLVGVRADVARSGLVGAGAVGVRRGRAGRPTVARWPALPAEQGDQGVGLVGVGALSDPQRAGLVEEDGAGGLQGSQQLGPGVGGEEPLQAEGPVAVGVVAQVAGIPDALVGGQGVLVGSGLGLGPQAPVGQLAVGLVAVRGRLDQLVGASRVEGQHPGHLAGPRVGELACAEGGIEAGVVPHLVGQPQGAKRGPDRLPGSPGEPLGRRSGPVSCVEVGLGRPLGRQGLPGGTEVLTPREPVDQEGGVLTRVAPRLEGGDEGLEQADGLGDRLGRVRGGGVGLGSTGGAGVRPGAAGGAGARWGGVRVGSAGRPPPTAIASWPGAPRIPGTPLVRFGHAESVAGGCNPPSDRVATSAGNRGAIGTEEQLEGAAIRPTSELSK